jgi:hypothetical protein
VFRGFFDGYATRVCWKLRRIRAVLGITGLIGGRIGIGFSG